MGKERGPRVGQNQIVDDLVPMMATWFQDKLTTPNTLDFVEKDEFHKKAVQLLNEILDSHDSLSISQAARLQSKVIARIYNRAFRVRVMRALLDDGTMRIDLELVNQKCLDDKEIGCWDDPELAWSLRRSWLPKRKLPGIAFVHRTDIGIGALDRQSKSGAGTIITLLKRALAWVARGSRVEEVMLVAARVSAAGKVVDAHFEQSAAFTEERDRLIPEFEDLLKTGTGN